MILGIIKKLIISPLSFNNKLKVVWRFVKWQISQRIFQFPIIYNFTQNSKLLIKKGMTGATGNLYYGLDEFNDMGFLLHFLRKKDVFIDVGSNIGSYTILASAEIGSKTISIEPAPSTFSFLKDNISLNNIGDLVDAHNIALAGRNGSIRFTEKHDTANHVAINNEKDFIEVQADTLDSLIKETNPSLIKIDVEGYESEVLKGANKTLKNPSLKALIVELNGSGRRYGFDDNDIHQKLIINGFNPFKYDPLSRSLFSVEVSYNQNIIYVRDVDFIKQRVKGARKIKINNFFEI
jgi:FkbM family methyltransferase